MTVFVCDDGIVHAADPDIDYHEPRVIGEPASASGWAVCEGFDTDYETTLYPPGVLTYQENLEVTCLACLAATSMRSKKEDR